MKKLLVIGTGYVGLVSGACMAEMGHRVICLDINHDKIDKLNQGILPIYEPNLEEIVRRNVKDQRLFFTKDYASSVKESTILFLTVDTPIGKDGHADLTYIFNAARSIAQHMDSYRVIVTKSTVPVGTAEAIRRIITETLNQLGKKVEFDIVSNPEFLKEGNAVNDFMKPDRVILGVDNERSIAAIKDIYAPFMMSNERLIIMDIPSAEMTKYAANAMLATRISFMNDLANLCELTGADIDKVRKGIGPDKRIGYHFLYSGPGFGGSCFPKDIRALTATAKAKGHPLEIIEAVERVNARQKKVLGNKIKAYFADKGGLKGKTIGILGLSFKPDTDDMREAPALVLIEELLDEGASLRLFDPVAMENAKKIIQANPSITWCENKEDVAINSHAIVLVTEWKQFRYIDFEELSKKMAHKALFDGRNQYNPTTLLKHGFDYISIGKATRFASQYIRNEA